MPRDFAIYEVPVEDLDDPTDVFQTLKKRLEDQIREEAHLIVQSDLDKIDRAFFQRKKRHFMNVPSLMKVKDNLTHKRYAEQQHLDQFLINKSHAKPQMMKSDDTSSF